MHCASIWMAGQVSTVSTHRCFLWLIQRTALWARSTWTCWGTTSGPRGSAVRGAWVWPTWKSRPLSTTATATACRRWCTRCWSGGKWRREASATQSGSCAALWRASSRWTSSRRSWTPAVLPPKVCWDSLITHNGHRTFIVKWVANDDRTLLHGGDERHGSGSSHRGILKSFFKFFWKNY